MNQAREHWGSKFGFVMAALGSAVGLGILWKFPYTVGENGGGYFLLTYILCTIFVGIPIFISELLIGRASQRAAVGAFAVLSPHKNFQMVGWLGALASFLIMSFYSVISGYGVSYILASLNGAFTDKSAKSVREAFKLLSESPGISLFWHGFFTLITMLVVYSGVRKGIEKTAKIVTRALLIILIGLFSYSVTLDGFHDAVIFIFRLDRGSFSMASAIEALGLAFWTLSIGQGIMISYGSYMKKTTNVLQMAFIIAVSVIIVALLAALTIFPVVFSFDYSPSSGYGLVFETLPFLFSRLPGSLLLSTLFFTLFVFTALTSAIPLIEVVATNLMEVFSLSRKKAASYVALATFLFGIPSALCQTGTLFKNWKEVFGLNFLDTVNSFVSIWVIPITGLFTAIFVGFVMNKKELKGEFEEANPYRMLFKPYYFFMRFVVPTLILLIIIQKSGIFS